MFKRFSAPLSPKFPPKARTAGRSPLRSARHLIGARAFSKPERIYFSGMAWAWGCGITSAALVASLDSGWMATVVCGSGLVISSAMAFDYRIVLRDYFRCEIDHATTVQAELHLDNAALRQELGFANRALAEYRRYIQILAAGQGGEAEGDELCGESPSAEIIPFRRMLDGCV